MEEKAARPAGCPSWCRVWHGSLAGEENLLHVGEEITVKGSTRARLVMSADPATGRVDGPYALVGDDELTISELRALGATLLAMADSVQADASLALG